MCGIGAFQLREGDGDPRLLAQSLLRELVIRGRDASGVAWHADDKDESFIQKFNCDGVELAKYLDEHIGRTAIVHTRYATQGSPKDNDNNHPIDVNGVLGVHNGHINNDDELFKKVTGYKRKGTVDSEAAFAYLRYGPAKRSLANKLSDIEGGAAIMWLQTNSAKRYLHVARLSSSPLAYGRSVGGSVVLASTESILRAACKEAGIELATVTLLDEGQYIRFENCEVTRTLDIPECRKPKFTWKNPYSSSPHPSSRVATTEATNPRLPLDIGTGVGGEFRDGRWHTALDLLLDQWDREAREDN